MKIEDAILKNGDKIMPNYFYRKHAQDKWRKVLKGYIGRIYNADLMYRVRRPLRTIKPKKVDEIVE